MKRRHHDKSRDRIIFIPKGVIGSLKGDGQAIVKYVSARMKRSRKWRRYTARYLKTMSEFYSKHGTKP